MTLSDILYKFNSIGRRNVPSFKGKLTYGFGAVTIWPTNSDDTLGSDKLSVDPSLVMVYSQKKYLLTAVISQWWSAGGDPNAADVSSFYFQPIFTYFLHKKWYLSNAPILTADLFLVGFIG